MLQRVEQEIKKRAPNSKHILYLSTKCAGDENDTNYNQALKKTEEPAPGQNRPTLTEENRGNK